MTLKSKLHNKIVYTDHFSTATLTVEIEHFFILIKVQNYSMILYHFDRQIFSQELFHTTNGSENSRNVLLPRVTFAQGPVIYFFEKRKKNYTIQ